MINKPSARPLQRNVEQMERSAGVITIEALSFWSCCLYNHLMVKKVLFQLDGLLLENVVILVNVLIVKVIWGWQVCHGV